MKSSALDDVFQDSHKLSRPAPSKASEFLQHCSPGAWKASEIAKDAYQREHSCGKHKGAPQIAEDPHKNALMG